MSWTVVLTAELVRVTLTVISLKETRYRKRYLVGWLNGWLSGWLLGSSPPHCSCAHEGGGVRGGIITSAMTRHITMYTSQRIQCQASVQPSEFWIPTPSSPCICCSPLFGSWGGTHSLAGEGVRGPNSYDWPETLVLSNILISFRYTHGLNNYKDVFTGVL